MIKMVAVKMLVLVVVFGFGAYIGHLQYDSITYIRSGR